MIFSNIFLLILSGLVFFLTWICTWIAIPWLRKVGSVDKPNQRSSHALPTPTGGGIVPVIVICVAWSTLIFYPDINFNPDSLFFILLPALFLALVSWIDDLKSLSPLIRLVTHFLAVSIGILSLPGLVFQGYLPVWADIIVTSIIWIWFINLFNFMDGIDGIACSEIAAIGFGIAIVSMLSFNDEIYFLLGLIVSSAALGFILWNWAPAKIFLGDAGAIPLAFLVGWLLLVLCSLGQWASAIILPLAFFADATITLFYRVLNFESPLEPHRSHFYQKAAINLGNHKMITLTFCFTNLCLIIIAIYTVIYPEFTIKCLFLAFGLVGLLLFSLHRIAMLKKPLQ